MNKIIIAAPTDLTAARARKARPRRAPFAAGSRAQRVTILISTVAVLVSGTILGHASQSAFAVDYPSWADVQAARADVKAADAKITQLESLLAGLKSQSAQAQTTANQLGAAFEVAQLKYDEAAFKLAGLRTQATEAQVQADKSIQKAGQFAAQLSRTGGSDLSARLFFSGSESTELLSQLGLASVVKDQAAGLFAKATQDKNSAFAAAQQASLAEHALAGLSAEAKSALASATAASEKAAAAVTEQAGNSDRLEAQRAVLLGTSTATEADYNTGVAERAAEAARVKAAAEKAAADYLAAHPPSTGGSGGGGSSALPSGWIRPSAGNVSSPFGYRVNPVTGDWALHAGTDLAPGCNVPILAAHSGKITFAGHTGGYGNFILMNNGDGIITGYGHIVDGGIMVSVGDTVTTGQQIARVGSTGQSTGCHLHFEVRPNGNAIDAAPFMRARGVIL